MKGAKEEGENGELSGEKGEELREGGAYLCPPEEK